jgi:uncharacterized protein YndB with AHSA1/START domain
MKYSDGPSVELDVLVAAPVDRVWRLVADINLPARFSTEFLGARWLDDGPGVGARFQGRSRHKAMGEWQTTSFVTRYEPGRAFSWAVSDVDHPSSSWWFELESEPGGVRLRQGARMGPAPSGLTIAITAMPDKEERIVALADIDLTVAVGVEFTEDVEAAGRRHAEGYAFTFGAMGSASTNFYNNAFERQGYGDDVRAVQRMWLDGDKEGARKRVPTAIVNAEGTS